MQEFGIQIEWTITATRTPLTPRSTRSTRSTTRNPTMCAATSNTWGTREHARSVAVFVVSLCFGFVTLIPCTSHIWLKMFAFASHSITWSSPCRMHELSVLSDFLDLFINFTFLLFFILNLQHFNLSEVKW